MFRSANPKISLAAETDCFAITALLNSAYRGESSKKGWTTEAHLIEGDSRADEASLLQQMQQPGNVFLKYEDDAAITGCVNLQHHGHKIYLGMFSVSPSLQGGGLGKQLLAAAEEYTKYAERSCIYMSVISARTELIQWYQRHGYQDTGARKPFHEDGRSGKHLQPLEFMILEKSLAQ